ncbi:hypothetical protein ACLSU7_00825 [Bdellovibrio sp. HCB185ZH]
MQSATGAAVNLEIVLAKILTVSRSRELFVGRTQAIISDTFVA